MSQVDLLLWALVVALVVLALWLGRPRPRGWDVAARFRLLREAAEGGAVEGPLGLGPTVAAADLATGSPAFVEAVARRLERDCLVWFEPPPVRLPGVPTETLPAPGAAEAALEALLDRRDRRLVLAARAEAGALLRLLHDAPGLRDRCRAVLLLAPALAGEGEWMAEHFTHKAFDLELARTLPFLVLRERGVAGQVLRVPDPPREGHAALEVIDLGELDADALASPATARALAGVIAALAG